MPPTSGGFTKRVRAPSIGGPSLLRLQLDLAAPAADGEQSILHQFLPEPDVALAGPDLLERLLGQIADLDADERAEIGFAAERDPRVEERIEAAARQRRTRRVVR